MDLPPAVVAKPLTAAEIGKLSEEKAAARIGKLGGWVERANFDGQTHVVELNMAYHESEENGYETNRIMTDEGLFYVHKFPKLRVLALIGDQASDKGLANLSGMKSVEDVRIWDAHNVSDDGARWLAELPNLKKLHMSDSQISNQALVHFAKLKHIEILSLTGRPFSDAGLAALKETTSLKELCVGYFEGFKQPDANTGESDMPATAMHNDQITDEGLKSLAGLTQLELLDLQNTDVTDAGLQSLRGLKNLKALWVSGTKVTKEGWAELAEVIPALKSPE
jgi:internalin A